MFKYKIISFCAIILLLFGCTPSIKKDKEQVVNSGLLVLLDGDGTNVQIKTISQWAQKRLQILGNMQKLMGDLPPLKGLPDFDIVTTDSLIENNYKRYSINFRVAENEKITAYLYVPNTLKTGKHNAAMLALHETDPLGKASVDGQGVNKNLGYAKELAQRGYIVIAPDYPSFGDMKDYDFKRDRYQSGTMKGIFDHIRCIDLLQSMPNVDPGMIGVIGHSLGGHNSIFVGAFDTRLKIVVSSCGWTNFDYYNTGPVAIERYGNRLGPWAIPRYMPLLKDKFQFDPSKIPLDFDAVITAIAPRVFFSNSPVDDKNFDVAGVKKGIENASSIFNLLGVPGNLRVYYPDSKHDFPPEIRMKAYTMIDKVLEHNPADYGIQQ